MHININNPYNCCGCSACSSICPHNAIEMEEDSLGFKYPKVKIEKCVECSLCLEVCDFHKEYSRIGLYENPMIYGCRHKNEEELKKSQSGGLAYAIAENFIINNGVVYGAVMEGIYKVVHKRCLTIHDLENTRFSKYIQSDPQDNFQRVKSDLRQGRKVLYIGTPCQIAGLKSYIGKKQNENLYTCDLVCHAAPSPKVWEMYCRYIEKSIEINPDEVKFRDKQYGWHSHFETFEDMKSKRKVKTETFRKLFYDHLDVRKSCSVCPFTNMKRVGDVTCGDFWGWERFHQEWNDNKGVSLALINSNKGEQLIANAQVDKINSNPKECLQPQLSHPIELNPKYEQFVFDFANYGFEYVAKKYADLSWWYILLKQKSKINRMLRNLKQIIKKYI